MPDAVIARFENWACPEDASTELFRTEAPPAGFVEIGVVLQPASPKRVRVVVAELELTV